VKTKLIITLTLVALSTFLLGCTIAQKQVSIEVSCDDFYKNHHISNEVQVSTGGTITVTLCSDPSTGLQWEPTVCCPLLSIILAEVDHKYIPPEETGNTPPAFGATGKEKWIYKAYNKGTATISLDYRRPGESGERGKWTYKVIAHVQ
jgi:predicted secreted protein